MRKLTTAQLLVLADLFSRETEPATGYEIMIRINQFCAVIDRPYSPGALYPTLKKLIHLGMININQSKYTIASSGKALLSDYLTSSLLTLSVTEILYFLAAAQLCGDPLLSEKVLRRLDIEMIKINHNDQKASSKNSARLLSPNSVRLHMGNALRQIVISTVAQNKAL